MIVNSIDTKEIRRITRQIMSKSSEQNQNSLLNEQNLSKFSRGELSQDDVECIKTLVMTKVSKCYNDLIKFLCSLKLYKSKTEVQNGYRLDYFI